MASKTTKGQTAGRRLIEAAIDGMRVSGLSGAGINEIARASGAPQGFDLSPLPGRQDTDRLRGLAALLGGGAWIHGRSAARARLTEGAAASPVRGLREAHGGRRVPPQLCCRRRVHGSRRRSRAGSRASRSRVRTLDQASRRPLRLHRRPAARTLVRKIRIEQH